MRAFLFLSIAAAIPAMAVDGPPPIPSGDIIYDDVTYDPMSYAPADNTTYETTFDNATAPATASTYSERGYINLNVYTSQYQVRGMGVTNALSQYGYSSISGSYTFPNRNLFHAGIEQRIFATYGYIYDANSILGETPLFHLGYGLSKELFPNFKVELAYNLRHGGLEGAVARYVERHRHRMGHDLTLTATYNDHQRGFFGHAMAGFGFEGLTGTFYDLELGYRATDLAALGNVGLDVEFSGGLSASLGYWGPSVEGIDAYRLRVAALPYTHGGGMGRDGHFYIEPWAQVSWSGRNSGKIDRAADGAGLVDHFQFCFGVDMGVKF